MPGRQYFNKLWKFIYDNIFILIVSIICIIVVYSPNIQKDIVVGSDYFFHLARIETLALSIRNGVFPVKVHSALAYGMGYGVGLFYPNFFLYIPAILMNAGLSLEVSYKLFAALIQVGIFWGGYYANFKLTRNKYVSLFAAILYHFSVAVLESFYTHFTLGQSISMIFLPLAIAGIYLIITTEKNCHIFVLGFSGLIYSHVLNTVLATLACLLIAAILWKKWMKNFIIWKKLIISTVIVLILTAAFWIPLMEQWLSQPFRASVPWTFVDENVLRIYDLFNHNSIGFLLLSITIFIGLWLIGNWHVNYNKLFFFVGLGFMLITTVSKFWTATRNIFKFLQFPSRLLVIATVLLIFAAALWLIQFDLKESSWKVMISVLLVLSIYEAVDYIGSNVNNLEDFGTRILYEEIAGIGAGEEWLPIQTTRANLVNPTTAYDDLGNSIEGVKEDGVFYVSVDGKSKYYNVPFVWYKGYAASINGDAVEVVQIEQNGLARVIIDDTQKISENNMLVVWYKGTLLQKIAYGINLMGVLILGIWCVICISKKIHKSDTIKMTV